jgi:CTP synthase (UTP-ammonia lyase)
VPAIGDRNALQIGIVGDFHCGKHSNWATEAALFHAAARLGLAVEPRWVPTTALSPENAAGLLAGFDGIWGAPGSPFESMAGMLRGIAFAREHNVPFLGTCAGFQYALIEFTRNVLGVPAADSAENDSGSANIVITPVACPVPTAGGPRLDGQGTARPAPDTLFAPICGAQDLRGEYFCSFETNAAFIPRWLAAGLRIAAYGSDGDMRAFELPSRRFLVATLFQPQLSSSIDRPHPIIDGYLRACAQ